jgi:hypothetical protein
MDAVINGPGELDAALRQAAARGAGLPPILDTYAQKVRRHAYKVVDDDVAGLKAAGYTEGQIFELTHAAAFGAGRDRLDAALAAMSDAD